MPKRKWSATWTETRQVSGVVYATSKTDAAKRIRAGEGLALRAPKPSCSAPHIRGERPTGFQIPRGADDGD